jgi:pimeloyl-ACP methyl ester carboxylesterase
MSWLLFWLLSFCAAQESQSYWIQAADGGWVAAHRYERAKAPSVVLCHGISSNHHFWDLQPERSLALALYAAGYDVWNIDLRGHGDAVRDPDGRRQRPGWTLDTYGTQDLPAVFAFVQAETGQSSLQYVGHSMGGMVLAIYLAHHGESPLTGAVVVASPLDFKDPDLTVKTMLLGAPLFKNSPSLPTPMLAKMLSHVHKAAPMHAAEFLYNPENMQPDVVKTMLRRIVSPLSRGEIKQFATVGADGLLRSMDGEIDYLAAMAEIELPLLFLTGRADRVASPDRVRGYYDAVGSSDKALEIASVANGYSADYGHLGFGLGDEAAREIFPLIISWLEKYP